MAAGLQALGWLFGLGIAAAVVGIVYLIYAGLRADHETGNYHFTWGVGVVLLFLMGFAPGVIGLGLYATVERDFPIHWLVLSVFLAVLVVAAFGYGTVTASTVEAGPV